MTTIAAQPEGGLTRGYADIAGHSTWYADSRSAGEPLLMLHSGLSHSDAMLGSIRPALSDRFRIVAFDRRGHGRTADTEAAFHYADMTTEAIGVLEMLIGAPTHLVGWSDGGIVALLVALSRPELVRSLVLIGTNYNTDGWIPNASDDSPSSDSPFMATAKKSYVERSPDGPEHFDVVVKKSAAMWSTEPTLRIDDLRTVSCPALVIAGDDDLVGLAHTASLYESLPMGQLAVVPGTSHAVVLEKPDFVSRLIGDFLSAPGRPETNLPVRRRKPPEDA